MPLEAPLFSIEHAVEIDATPEGVWAVLSDLSSYAEWNPYVLAISGRLDEGSTLDVTIAQENWPEPLNIRPVVVRAIPNRILHWRGQLGDGGLLDTDHSFEIDPIGSERVRFLQREDFRGSLAEKIDEQSRGFIRDAFQAMNEALARRAR